MGKVDCLTAESSHGLTRKSSKPQAPITREFPIPKLQRPELLDVWRLRFEASLELGLWNLEILN
jgi:hypothetical protein